MCGFNFPGSSLNPIVPAYSLPCRSHLASLNRLVGWSSSTVVSVSEAPVITYKTVWDVFIQQSEFSISSKYMYDTRTSLQCIFCSRTDSWGQDNTRTEDEYVIHASTLHFKLDYSDAYYQSRPTGLQIGWLALNHRPAYKPLPLNLESVTSVVLWIPW